MPNALIYCRISSDPGHDLLGVTRQEQESRSLAERNGWPVVGVYVDDDVSAFSGKRRPQYEEMLTAIRAGVGKVIIAWHPDRLHRSPRELESFIDIIEAARAKVHTVQSGEYDLSTASGRMTARVVGAVARHESEHKSERMKSKIAQNARAGLPSGGSNRPFGYEADKVTVRSEEAALVREIGARLLNGETLRSVTAWANTMGVKTVRGVEWDPTRIRSLATSYRYCGLRAVGKGVNARVVADAVWPAIVDRVTVDKLRGLLFDPARRTNRSARKYLLSGLVVCGRCGEKMVARPRTNKSDADGQRTRTYMCSSDPGRRGCGRCRIVAVPLEELIAERVVAQVVTMAQLHRLTDAAPEFDAGVSSELAALDSKSASLAAQWAAGELSDAEWAAARAGLTERRARLSSQVRRSVNRVPAELAVWAKDPDAMRAAWPEAPFDIKRRVVASLIEGVVIGEGVPGARRFNPDRIIDLRWKQIG